MKANIFPILVAIIMIGGAILSSPSAVRVSEAHQFDFAGLHDQAAFALQTLQVSQARRLAAQQIDLVEF